MADLFLHLPFARRLRLAEGLHPLIGEALTRRPSLVALGATLPLLPGIERQGMSFFRRLFAGGSEAARWQKHLQAGGAPRAGLVTAYLTASTEPGPMARLSLALGGLAHELLEARLAPAMGQVGAGERAAVERAQARLWLQSAVPNVRDLEVEWHAVDDLADVDQHKRTFAHVDASLKMAFSAGPGRDALGRWARSLVQQMTPALQQGLPPSTGMADHVARGPWFDQPNLIALIQDATRWFVVVANRLGEQAARDEGLTASTATRALCGDGTSILGTDAETPAAATWTDWITSTRKRTLERGRNERPAFIEGVGEVKPIHRSNAFTGVMRLSDLPPGEVPPELQNPSLPPESSAATPPVPHTQEISLAQIEGATSLPPLPLDASGPVPVAPPSLPPVLSQAVGGGDGHFAPPAMTQEISVAQIESEAAAFAAPAHTQEVSVVQIEAQAPAGEDPPRE
jgi:hypothetical protein